MNISRHRLVISTVTFLVVSLLTLLPGTTDAAPPANLYVSAPSAGIVYKVAPDGTQTSFTAISQPRGLAFDSFGNLFVANSQTGLVSIVTPAGEQRPFASGLSDPVSVVIDSSANVFVADIGTNIIYKFTSTGTQSTFASGLSRPAGLTFDSAGNLYESEGDGNSINKFTPAGVKSTFTTAVNKPAGLAFDSQGNLYEADQNSNTILKFAPNGTFTTFATFDNSVDFEPIRIVIDPADNVYVSETANSGVSNIYEFTPTGMRTVFKAENTLVSFIAFAPVVQLLNISTRLQVGTGENALIGGFIVTGTDPKTVLIRGIGPSLTGVGATLADPTLELHQGGTILATNDNWKINDATGQSQEAAINATTIPPGNDMESAILVTLNPGAYTAILAGKNGTTGVGLVEFYDLLQSANSQLANISTRGLVNTGNNVMIGGLIVGGGSAGGATKVIVRALGPSLGSAGIQGALADPTLELHDANGDTIATNDNWKTAADGSSQQAEVEATTIPPTNDLESALVVFPNPGNYTAIVRGNNNGTGVSLVEVYNLP